MSFVSLNASKKSARLSAETLARVGRPRAGKILPPSKGTTVCDNPDTTNQVAGIKEIKFVSFLYP